MHLGGVYHDRFRGNVADAGDLRADLLCHVFGHDGYVEANKAELLARLFEDHRACVKRRVDVFSWAKPADFAGE